MRLSLVDFPEVRQARLESRMSPGRKAEAGEPTNRPHRQQASRFEPNSSSACEEIPGSNFISRPDRKKR
ncbi:MAG TPA: hypothetical protein VGC64_06210 [Pyrinomonadaceae bacterium]